MKLGVITGMQFEAEIARKAARNNDRILIACNGPGPDAAKTAAETLIKKGANCLISFGIAGALDPALRPGNVIIPSSIKTENGIFKADQKLIKNIRKDIYVIENMVFSSKKIISSSTEKNALFNQTSATAVDMESGAVAQAAAHHTLPFIVLRVIADPATQALPRTAQAGARADGSVTIWPVIGALLKRPWELPDLIRLGRQTAIAKRALSDLALLSFPLLLLGEE